MARTVPRGGRFLERSEGVPERLRNCRARHEAPNHLDGGRDPLRIGHESDVTHARHDRHRHGPAIRERRRGAGRSSPISGPKSWAVQGGRERARRAGRVQPRLRTRLRLYFVIFLGMLGVVAGDTLVTATAPGLVIVGLIARVVGGVVVSRTYRLNWDADAAKVVSRIDRIGAAILVLYMVFAISRSWLIGHWVQGSALGPVGLSIVCGVMFGRVAGMSHGIRRVLRDAGIY